MIRTALRFGLLATALLALLYISKYSLFTFDRGKEIVIVAMALLLIGFGIVISKYIRRKEVVGIVDKSKIKRLHISQREYEVLQLIDQGKSNQQIGDLLFISESTVKKHVYSLFVKLDASRRTEAIQKAKQMSIL